MSDDQREGLPTADYLVKHKECPTCEGQKTSHYYSRRHVEINGEYFEFVTEDQLKELYSEDDFIKKHRLARRADVEALIQKHIDKLEERAENDWHVLRELEMLLDEVQRANEA